MDIVDVLVLVGMGEVAAADGVAERVYFAGPSGSDAGPSGCQREAADAITNGSVRDGGQQGGTHAALAMARW